MTAERIIDVARASRVEADRAEVRIAMAALAWCLKHRAGEGERPARLDIPGAGDSLRLAGDGAPDISEFCVAEFAAAVGMSTRAGRRLLGDVLELAFRLPRLWREVVEGEVQVWRARRVAELTRDLPREGALFVDGHLAAAHFSRIGQRTVDRLVEVALVRFDPESALARQVARAERRGVRVELDLTDASGLVSIGGVLDAPDALDLDAALNRIAAHLTELGSTEPLRVRRALALGHLARGMAPAPDPTASGASAHAAAPEPSAAHNPAVPVARQVTVVVHLTPEHLSGADAVVRCENTRGPVLAEAVHSWCEGARVTVRPVVDLNEPASVDRYEIPAPLASRVRLAETRCVFPYCEHPSRSSDLDHIAAYREGGPTSTGNLAPLCRQHHRLKTFAGWSYSRVGSTGYRWVSPTGQTYLRDHTGTRRLGASRMPPREREGMDPGARSPDRGARPNEPPGEPPTWAFPASPGPAIRT